MKTNTVSQVQYPILKTLNSVKEKLCISTIDGHLIVKKHDVSYIQADSNYSYIYHGGKKILCSQTLAEVSSRIRLSNFIRIHRSYLVNLEKVKFYSSCYSSLTMEDGSVLPISRTNKKLVKSKISMLYD